MEQRKVEQSVIESDNQTGANQLESTTRQSPLQALREDIKYEEKAPFEVTARVVMQLGRESISNSITAIIELVKNSYDADAENVSLSFSGIGTEYPFLVIEDDGEGMTIDQVRSSWLTIGTDSKLNGDRRSRRKKRVLTGEKGLGRLGIDRLCQETILQSFVNDTDDTEESIPGTELYIDWRKYEEDSRELIQEVEHSLRRLERDTEDPLLARSVGMSHGTRVILYALKDNWSEEYLQELRSELMLLISPFSGINDFKITVDSGMGWKSVDGSIESDHLLEGAQWKLLATLSHSPTSGDWEIEYLMYSDTLEKEYAMGPLDWKSVLQKPSSDSPACGPLRFEMYFYPRQKTSLADLTISKAQIESFLDSNQGVRIYRDDFRVKPYGEPDGTGDWLILSYRRQASPQGVAQEPLGGWRVGYNQVIGAVFISRDDNPNLVDQTNRESIVEGEAFNQMKEIISSAISFFERNRQKYEMARKEKNEFEKARERAERAAKVASSATDELDEVMSDLLTELTEQGEVNSATINKVQNTTSKVRKTATRALKTQEKLAEAADSQQEKLERQKDTLGNLASLGILAAAFGHETLGSSNIVHETSISLSDNLLNGLFMVMPDVKNTIEKHLGNLINESSKIETFARFTLRNVGRDKRQRRNEDLKDIVISVFGFFEDSLRERNITVDLSGVHDVPMIRAYRIDWESIIVNLITNAIWAMDDRPHYKRQLTVKLWEQAGQIHLTFRDSGIGLPASLGDDIFLPTISTKKNEEGEIIGTGMGLAIVKDFVESYPGGNIAAKTLVGGDGIEGAEFHIIVNVPKYSKGTK